MTRAIAARTGPSADEWASPPGSRDPGSLHEAPSILSFTGHERDARKGSAPEDLSEFLNRKFRETFP